jgi:hypothetical protein
MSVGCHFPIQKRLRIVLSRKLFPYSLLLLAALFPAAGSAAERVHTSCSFESFTNLAARLFQSQFNGSLTPSQIQVYPANQYTPAVHRLLQLAANICDATTNRADLTGYPLEDRRGSRRMFYRSVMLPLFGESLLPKKFLLYPGRSVFIGGDESRDFGCGQGHPDEGAHQ